MPNWLSFVDSNAHYGPRFVRWVANNRRRRPSSSKEDDTGQQFLLLLHLRGSFTSQQCTMMQEKSQSPIVSHLLNWIPLLLVNGELVRERYFDWSPILITINNVPLDSVSNHDELYRPEQILATTWREEEYGGARTVGDVGEFKGSPIKMRPRRIFTIIATICYPSFPYRKIYLKTESVPHIDHGLRWGWTGISAEGVINEKHWIYCGRSTAKPSLQ